MRLYGRNFDLALLLDMAQRFGFVVDMRGPWPIMRQGQRAHTYRGHRDAIDFISVTCAPSAYLSHAAIVSAARRGSMDVPNTSRAIVVPLATIDPSDIKGLPS